MKLRHDHALLLDTLVKGKLPRNLSWARVVDLIAQIGTVEPRENDNYAFVIGTQEAFFKKPSTHDLDIEELRHLRKFIRDAQMPDQHPAPTPSGRSIVVIDHHAAHIFQDIAPDISNDDSTVRPYDPFHFHHHLVHRKEAHYRGDRVPEENEYYEAVAKDLLHASEIVLIGNATGTSSAALVLSDYLHKHHALLAERIVATDHVDLSALTDAEIEALARKHIPASPEVAILTP